MSHKDYLDIFKLIEFNDSDLSLLMRRKQVLVEGGEKGVRKEGEGRLSSLSTSRCLEYFMLSTGNPKEFANYRPACLFPGH